MTLFKSISLSFVFGASLSAATAHAGDFKEYCTRLNEEANSQKYESTTNDGAPHGPLMGKLTGCWLLVVQQSK